MSLPSSGRPVDIISTRYNQDALDDLILLTEFGPNARRNGNDLSVSMSAPMDAWIVNSSGGAADGDLEDKKCDTGKAGGFTDVCTLRAAIQNANKESCAETFLPAHPEDENGKFRQLFR